jgi:hypothetical protein
LELNAEERANTLVGQNSTQKPQDLQRSTTIETRPFATGYLLRKISHPGCDYARANSQRSVTLITGGGEVKHTTKTAPAKAGAVEQKPECSE